MTTTTDVRWWPGRTDEVRRVADRLRRLNQPDGESDVFIVADAIDMNAAVAAVLTNAR